MVSRIWTSKQQLQKWQLYQFGEIKPILQTQIHILSNNNWATQSKNKFRRSQVQRQMTPPVLPLDSLMQHLLCPISSFRWSGGCFIETNACRWPERGGEHRRYFRAATNCFPKILVLSQTHSPLFSVWHQWFSGSAYSHACHSMITPFNLVMLQCMTVSA